MEKSSSSQRMREWYVKNREQYNAARREKYRERATQAKPTVKKMKPNPEAYETVVREINGKTTIGYSTSYVASRLGRTPQMLRSWEKDGYLPRAIFPDSHRYYSETQIGLIEELFLANEQYKRGEKTLSEFLAVRDSVNKRWVAEWQ